MQNRFLIAAACLLAVVAYAPAQVSPISYQGRLNSASQPYNGPADFEMTLFDAASSGNSVGSTLSVSNVPVTNGLFMAELNFDAGAFTDGGDRWLEIAVRAPAGSGNYTTLTPRQRLTATPYALRTRGLAVDAAGNVGIGTNSPGARVDARGIGLVNVFAGDLAPYGFAGYETNFSVPATHAWFAENGARIFSIEGGGNGFFAGGVHAAGVNLPGAFGADPAYVGQAGNFLAFGHPGVSEDFIGYGWNTFYLKDSPSGGDTVDPNLVVGGNVGIGTDLPSAKLHIGGTPGVDGIRFPDGTLQTTAAGGANAQMETLELTGGANSYYVIAWGTPDSENYGNQIVPMQKVFAGDGYNLGIRLDGELYYWGYNSNLEDPPCCGPFTQVSGGTYHGLALRADGTLAAWGQNYFGQLDLPEESYIAVSAGQYHSAAIRSDGTLIAVGMNDEGELDNIPEGTFVAVAAGASHTVAIRTDGTLAAWGSNYDGELDVPAGTFIAVSSGSTFSVGIRSDGTLAAWGANYDGQTNVPAGTFTAVCAGRTHVLALRTDGTLMAWGYGVDEYEMPPGTFTAIAAGSDYNLAIPTTTNPPALKLHYDSALKPGTNTWTISSDSRLKKNIRTMENSLEKLLQLRGVTFDWRDPASQGGRYATEMGMIADEVEKVFPQWVGRDARGYRTLTIGGFEGLTAEALRELRAEKDRQLVEHQQQLDALKAENAELRERLSQIETELRRGKD